MKHTVKVLLLFIGVIPIVRGRTTNVQECELFNASLPINTYVEGCTETPCRVQRRDFAVINIAFKSPRTIRTMRTLATALVFGAEVAYDLGENTVTCNHLTNTYCPVLKDEVVLYQLRMEILSIFPPITVVVEFRIVDDDNVSIICVRLPITVLL